VELAANLRSSPTDFEEVIKKSLIDSECFTDRENYYSHGVLCYTELNLVILNEHLKTMVLNKRR